MNRRTAMLAALGLALVVTAVGAFWVYGRLMHYEPGDEVSIDFAAAPAEARSELGLLIGQGDFYLQRCCANSVSHPLNNGKRVALFRVSATDRSVKNNLRAEARLLSNRVGREAVYHVILATPASWQPSPQRVLVTQWHGTNDFFVLEPGRFPPLELAIEGDRWVVLKAWDARRRSKNVGGGNTQGRQVIGSVPFSPGKEVDWRFDVRWSTGSDGHVRAYKDGLLVVDDKGPNAFNDFVGPYMKFGVYVPQWKAHPDHRIGERQAYFRLASMAQH